MSPLRHLATKRVRDDDGFTMVEILVVIIIIGILAAIAIPIYMNQQRAARESALTQDMRNAAMAFETFYASNDSRDVHHKADNKSWTVVVKDHPSVVFVGDPLRESIVTDIYPDGMNPIPVSDGVAIGIADSTGPSLGRTSGEYCLLGNATNTRYELKDPNAPFKEHLQHTLFYDSSDGGITEPEDLVAGQGACGYYATRIEKG